MIIVYTDVYWLFSLKGWTMWLWRDDTDLAHREYIQATLLHLLFI